MPLRLDLALIRLHPELSRRKARDVIEKGQVTLDGRTILEAGHSVEPGAALAWDPNRKARSRVRPSVPVLYEDEDLLVVDKPAGLLAVPTAPDAPDDSALARVQDYVARLRPRQPYVGVVHRLDRDTSGALAFALAPAARAALRALFRVHQMERVYAALVEGSPPASAGEVDRPIYDVYEGGRRRLARADEPSHQARTRWRVVERFPAGALLDVELETGRQHQIRLHLAEIGLPIAGDAVYGRVGRGGIDVPRQMLHARRLGFVHPTTGTMIRVESPLPEDFQKGMRALRHRRPEGPSDSGSHQPAAPVPGRVGARASSPSPSRRRGVGVPRGGRRRGR